MSEAPQFIFAGEQEPTGLNWLQAEDNAAWTSYVMQLVWPMAVDVTPQNEFIPREDFVDIELTSEDPQVVTYTINSEAAWSDGTPITADDFVFTWESQRDCSGEGENPFNCAGDQGYSDIESVEGSDDGKTVTVTYATPYADWISLFAPVFPVHKFTEAGNGDPVAGFNTGFKLENLTGANAANLENFVVSGSWYEVTSLEAGAQMTISRNPDYWGEPALIETIVFPWITDAAQQPAAIENGEADGGFPQAQIDLLQQLQAITGVTVEVGFGTFWEHLDLNGNNAHLAIPEVRQALAMALDRNGIVEALVSPFSGEAEVLNNRIFFPADPRYEDHGSETYGAQDIEGAQALLEEAGYTEGANGIYELDGQSLSLRLVWRDPNPRRQSTAELIQAQVREAGIDIQLSPAPDFTFLDNRDFDIALFGWTGGTVLSSSTSIYVAGGGQNYTDIADPRIQELYDEANVELDEDARADLMNQIDEILWEQMATIPLFQVPEVLVSRETFGNLIYNGFGGPTWNANTWGAI